MQKIIPEKFKYNITEWDCAMEQGRIKIELKCSGQYSDQAYINDYLSQALMTPCKSFNAEVSSLKTQWQLGSDSTLNKQKIRNIITQMYLNFDDNDTWAREISESMTNGARHRTREMPRGRPEGTLHKHPQAEMETNPVLPLTLQPRSLP